MRKGKESMKKRADQADKAFEREQAIDEWIQEINSEWPMLPTNKLKQQIVDRFSESVNRKQLRKYICLVCGESIKKFGVYPELLPLTDPVLDPHKVEYPEEYPNPFENHVALKNIVIELKGVVKTENDEDALQLCTSCYRTLSNTKCIPRTALTNGLLFGPVPSELRDLTIVEEAMIARRRCKCWVIHLHDNNFSSVSSTDMLTHHVNACPVLQRVLKGHIIVYPSHPDNLLNILPAPISETLNRLCVIFVGSGTPTKEWLKYKAEPLLVRREKVQVVLLWLNRHNPLYKNVIIDESIIEQLLEEDILPTEIKI